MTTTEAERSRWPMLLALTCAFALSQAYRTVAAIMAPPLSVDFALSAQQLGLFAATFHFAFGALQLFMGIGIDMHGVRRTVLAAFPLTIAGSAISWFASGFGMLIVGQVLIGIGCAPAFLVCTVFIARQFPAARFAAVSGAVLGLGGFGLLFTGTPLAWLIEASSWRAGFAVLGALSALAWLLILWVVREPQRAADQQRESLANAVRGFGALLAMPHTLGIVALGAVTYAAFVTLRGLWLGPMLIERHGFSLVASGNVALLMSVSSMLGPVIFGRFDPGPATRRGWIVGCTLAGAALVAAMAFAPLPVLDVGGSILFGLLSGYIVFQYADVRAAYPAAMTGRALALFTMSMFLGVALMQWFTGVVASAADAYALPVFTVVLATIAAMLAAGALAFRWLPRPPSPVGLGASRGAGA